MSETIKLIVDEFKTKGKMIYSEPATLEQIAVFEKTNNKVLPEEYKEWLLFSDGGDLFLPAGIQLYGVAHKPIIDVADCDKPDETYVVIGALAMGDPIVYKIGEKRISIYNHEVDRIEEDETFDDFYQFLQNLCSILGVGD